MYFYVFSVGHLIKEREKRRRRVLVEQLKAHEAQEVKSLEIVLLLNRSSQTH